MPHSPSHSSFLLLAGLCCLLSGSQTEGYQSTGASGHNKKNQEPLQCQNFAPIITNISLFLLQNAMHWPKQTNIVFSPVSITAAFAMLSLGAKGSTHKQILKGLKFSLMNKADMEVHRCFQYLSHSLRQPDHQLQLTTGSSLFINKHLRVADKFREAIRDLYHSEAIPVNFRDTQEAKTEINSHVMKRSYGQIEQMVDDLPIDTVLVLMNFISFSGIQNGEFQDKHTVEDKFYLDTGKVDAVPMINRLGKFDLHRDKSLSSWVLIQHYVGDAIVFFILPDLGKMQQLIENLSPEYLNSIQKHVYPR
ncbi:alpha-1-antiproteinase-like [Acomys russatus]|uniref:alpha-1-antiproteinase-like n=1 Tax=Acomys russatus TaxID=60746 RepID=UPI0021E2CE51|nr:alpha-1-antiproteinase-like [Acomys russatus]